jgi:hypothetical protein
MAHQLYLITKTIVNVHNFGFDHRELSEKEKKKGGVQVPSSVISEVTLII